MARAVQSRSDLAKRRSSQLSPVPPHVDCGHPSGALPPRQRRASSSGAPSITLLSPPSLLHSRPFLPSLPVPALLPLRLSLPFTRRRLPVASPPSRMHLYLFLHTLLTPVLASTLSPRRGRNAVVAHDGPREVPDLSDAAPSGGCRCSRPTEPFSSCRPCVRADEFAPRPRSANAAPLDLARRKHAIPPHLTSPTDPFSLPSVPAVPRLRGLCTVPLLDRAPPLSHSRAAHPFVSRLARHARPAAPRCSGQTDLPTPLDGSALSPLEGSPLFASRRLAPSLGVPLRAHLVSPLPPASRPPRSLVFPPAIPPRALLRPSSCRPPPTARSFRGASAPFHAPRPVAAFHRPSFPPRAPDLSFSFRNDPLPHRPLLPRFAPPTTPPTMQRCFDFFFSLPSTPVGTSDHLVSLSAPATNAHALPVAPFRYFPPVLSPMAPLVLSLPPLLLSCSLPLLSSLPTLPCVSGSRPSRPAFP